MVMEIAKILDSQTAKYNFIKGLFCLAIADGQIDDTERTFFLTAASQLGMQAEPFEQLSALLNSGNADHAEIRFNTRQQAVFFVREALQLCYVDGSYGKKEREVLEAISANCGLEGSLLASMEEWVMAGIRWRAAGEKFMEEV